MLDLNFHLFHLFLVMVKARVDSVSLAPSNSKSLDEGEIIATIATETLPDIFIATEIGVGNVSSNLVSNSIRFGDVDVSVEDADNNDWNDDGFGFVF